MKLTSQDRGAIDKAKRLLDEAADALAETRAPELGGRWYEQTTEAIHSIRDQIDERADA